MSRASRRTIVLAAVLSLVGLLVSRAGAAPRVVRPSWVTTQGYDEQGQPRVTVRGLIPADARGDYDLTISGNLANQCVTLFDCVWAGFDPVRLSAGSPKQTQEGPGWNLTVEQSRSAVVITLVLTSEFLLGMRFVTFEVNGWPTVPGYPTIYESTGVREYFQSGLGGGGGGGGSGAALEVTELLGRRSAEAPRVAWTPRHQIPAPSQGVPVQSNARAGLSLASLLLLGFVSWRRR